MHVEVGTHDTWTIKKAFFKLFVHLLVPDNLGNG